MIRKIAIDKLQPGMYVVDLHRSWLSHTFWRSRFAVTSEDMVRRLIEEGISEVSIDTRRGIDIPPPPPGPPPPMDPNYVPRSERLLAKPKTITLGEERRRAGLLLGDATQCLEDLMAAARVGQAVEVGRLEPVVARMIESVMRNPDALPPMARLKLKGGYAVGHAVSTAALVVAFGRQQGLPEAEIEKLAALKILRRGTARILEE